MNKLIKLGVDGLISDYPDRLAATLRRLRRMISPTKAKNKPNGYALPRTRLLQES